jgi:hypothetical protein
MPEPINSTDSLTVVQIVLWFGTFAGGAMAAFLGVRAKLRRNGNGDPREPRRSIGGGVEWFWDGPVGKVLEILQAIYREQKQIREDAARHADERNRKMDEQTGILREIEDNTRDRSGRPTRRG